MSYGSRRLRDYTRASGFVQTIPVYPEGTIIWPTFNGVSATNTLPTDVSVLANFAISDITQLAGTYNFTGATGNYLFIVVPKYFGLVTTFTGPITNWTLLTPSPAITSGLGVTGNSTTDVPLQININGQYYQFNVYVSNTTSGTATPSITVA